jgi:tRNA (guanine-N7-)-methyltransferase
VPKKKLIHFEENLTFPHLFQPKYHDLTGGFILRQRWNEEFFRNGKPITLELGCGKGEYTVGLAEKYPERNFIGIDYKGARLWRGCKTVEEKGLVNVAFIRNMADHLEKFFAPDEVSEIWVTFPDPQPKKERRRLTAPVFLEKYRKVMHPGGIIHLKTDNIEFFEYTLEIVAQGGHNLLWSTDDLYHSNVYDEVMDIQTFYEKIWLAEGKRICYLRFTLRPE